MSQFLYRLEQKIGGFCLPHRAIYLIFGQAIILIMSGIYPHTLESAYLIPEYVYQGQVWRLFTYILIPPTKSFFFLLIEWYILYFMGEALEQHWGVFRFNMFVLIGIISMALAGMIFPGGVNSHYLLSTIFLAFAFLNPDYEFLLFFVLPVKVKWLASLTWVLYGYQMLVAPSQIRVAILASVANYLLFFHKDIYQKIRHGKTSMVRHVKAPNKATKQDSPIHKCYICGTTDRDNPKLDFRYCSDCSNHACYCEEHLDDHTCVTGAKS